MNRLLFFAFPPAAFLLVSVVILGDYGPNIDSQKNFAEGENNLAYLLSGRADPVVSRGQIHGALTFMLADAARRLLNGELELLDPISARHAILPLLIAGFIPSLLWFVKRHWDAPAALAAATALLTFPEFLGHAFNNLKDVPLLICFSLAIMSFAEWRNTGRLPYLYGHFVCLGVVLSIKLYALLVPVILLAWEVANRLSASDGALRGSRDSGTLRHWLLGTLITLLIVAICYMPSFWALESKSEFFTVWLSEAERISVRPQGSWDAYPLQQVLYRTPLPMLLLAGLGLAAACLPRGRTPMNRLLALWLFVPILLQCLPRLFPYHNGMRLFLVFLVPFSVVAAQGLAWLAATVSQRVAWRRSSGALRLAGFGLLLGGNLWAAVTTHPYQTTYYNSLAGGLKGAQESGIRWACDYWLNSYKEAGRWLTEQARGRANIITVYYSGTPPAYNTDLMKFSLVRDDVRVFRTEGMPDPTRLPGNTYVVFVPFHYLQRQRAAFERRDGFQAVWRITRQEGEILTIYYKP